MIATTPQSITKKTTLGSQFVIISHATEGSDLSRTYPFLIQKRLDMIQPNLQQRLKSGVLLIETKNSKQTEQRHSVLCRFSGH